MLAGRHGDHCEAVHHALRLGTVLGLTIDAGTADKTRLFSPSLPPDCNLRTADVRSRENERSYACPRVATSTSPQVRQSRKWTQGFRPQDIPHTRPPRKSDRFFDTDVSHASTEVFRHRRCDFLIHRVGALAKQRCRLHDLGRPAVATPRCLGFDPRRLHGEGLFHHRGSAPALRSS